MKLLDTNACNPLPMEPMADSAPLVVGPVLSSSSPIPIGSPSKTASSENFSNLSVTSGASVSSKSSTGSSYTARLNAEPLDYKKLNRGISRATDNEKIVSRARSEIALVDNAEETDADQLFIETPMYTFTLPDLSQYPDDFRTFLEKDLIALSTQVSLEQAQRLNWWTAVAQKLFPLSTSGDGNCLLHAASLGIWGFHDRLLTLRKALHVFLSQSPRKEALWRRWKYQQSKLNEQSGLVYSELEWRREWNAIVSMASTVPRLRRQSLASNISGTDGASGAIYESLEEIHVLALAHVLRRPIIVVADTVLKDMNGEDLAPIPFGGIYLPLECPPSSCLKPPLLLAYDGGHFSALVAMDGSEQGSQFAAIPLVDNNRELLPIQFNIDPGPENDNNAVLSYSNEDNINLLAEYLEVLKLDPQSNSRSADGPDSTSSSNTTSNNNNNSSYSLLGSLGKSVGAKLRSISRSNSQLRSEAKKPISTRVMCAQLHTKNRTEYQDVLIQNYLRTARVRFDRNQKEEKLLNDQGPRYGAGKSQFYTESTLESHEKINALTPLDPIGTSNDSTVYLSKSTFYDGNTVPPDSPLSCQAKGCGFYANPSNGHKYCSKCYQDLVLSADK